MKPWETDETFLSRWLNKELTPEELRLFEASPEYDSYVQTASALDDFEVGDFDQQASLASLKKRIENAGKAPPVTRSLRRSWYYLAAAVAALLIGIAIWQFGAAPRETEVIASQDEQLTLPDGSTIALQAGSRVRYHKENWDANRLLHLEGQAYFEVAEGKKFDILMKQGKVSILGTRFNIIEKPDTLRVVCYDGKVQVEAFGGKEVLNPGEGVTAIRDIPLSKETTSLPKPVWVSGQVVFRDTPMRKVLAQLKEIYGVEVIGNYDPETLCNGAFPTDDLEAALSQVLGPFSLNYQFDPARNAVILE